MKKLYSLLFALLTFAGMTNAQVVFDFAANPWGLTLGTGEDAEAGNVSSVTQEDVVINLTLNAESGTPPRMWTGPQLRIYANNVIEIVADKEIKSVTFTFTLGSSKDADGNTINYLVGPKGEQVVTKVACATSGKTVTFTTAHTKGHLRITKIEVGFDGDTPGPGPDPQTIDWTSSATAPLTVAQALEKAAQLEAGADSGKDVYVKGKISQIDEVSPKLEDGSGYGNATYYISDDGTTTNQFYVYRGKSLKGADFTSEDEIKVGDEVIVVGVIKNYVKDETSTLEFNQGNRIYSLNGDNGGDDPQPGDAKTIAEVIAAGAATAVVTSGTVYASCPNGVIIGDGTGYIYAYRPSESAEVGDVVKITGNVSQYGGCFQFGQGCTLEKTGTASVTYPAVKEIDGAAFDALVEAPAVTYVKVAGTLKISGNYKNLEIAGATNMGSLQVSDAVLGSAGDGDAVEVTGFFAYKSGSSTIYGNILATEVKVTGDTPDPEAPEYTTIAAVKEAVTADRVNVVFKANNLLVTYVNGKNVYVFDGTDGLSLYANDASLNEGIKAGDKITADFNGKLYLFKGLTEIATSAIENLTVNSSDNAVEPQKVTIADVNNNPKDYENELVQIEGLYAQAEALASRNITFMDDSDNEVVVRDNWNVLANMAFNTESEYTVTGFVAIFANDGSTTTQIYPRTAEDVSNGETPQPYELAGEGTLEKPYTVADVQYLYAQEDCPTDPVWVKGVIVGAAKSTMNNIIKEQGDDLQVSNIVLADNAEEATSTKMIPVQLASTNEVTKNVRAKLNLVDNFDNLGKEVWVFGTIERYITVAGIKNTSDYSFDGKPIGIYSGECGENLTWTYVEATQTLIISGSGAMTHFDAGEAPWNEYCADIQNLVIEEGITRIGENAFNGCSAITSAEIPEGVTRIYDNAFYGCSSLTTVTIPSTVTRIYDNAFANCTSLADVSCYADAVPSAEDNTFAGTNIANATLNVNKTAIDSYSSTSPWSGFGTIAKFKEPCATPTITFANGKVHFACETEDVEFVSTITVGASEAEQTGSVIDLGSTFTVSVFARREGYLDSDKATATINIASMGDLNGDGQVTIADVTSLVNVILGK